MTKFNKERPPPPIQQLLPKILKENTSPAQLIFSPVLLVELWNTQFWSEWNIYMYIQCSCTLLQFKIALNTYLLIHWYLYPWVKDIFQQLFYLSHIFLFLKHFKTFYKSIISVQRSNEMPELWSKLVINSLNLWLLPITTAECLQLVINQAIK